MRTLSDSNGIQNVAKSFIFAWRTIHSGLLIYELSCCGLESRGCHTKNMKKVFRSTTGIILCSIELSFFSILSKNVVLLLWTEKNNTLDAFTRISFFNVYEILLCKFFQEVWRVLRCSSVLRGHRYKDFFVSNCLPQRQFMFL